jgi:hypothetical protein
MARSFIAKALLAAALLAVAACAPRYVLVPPSAKTTVGKIDVRSTLAWSRIANMAAGDVEASESWTIDGQRLHVLLILSGVAEGETLFTPAEDPYADRDKLPKFRADMPLEEIASLFEASLTTATRSSLFQYTGIGPATVLGQPGIRMEFSFTGQDQLDRDGVAVATVKDGKLYLIAYQGSRLLHYGKYLPEVEGILQNAALKT